MKKNSIFKTVFNEISHYPTLKCRSFSCQTIRMTSYGVSESTAPHEMVKSLHSLSAALNWSKVVGKSWTRNPSSTTLNLALSPALDLRAPEKTIKLAPSKAPEDTPESDKALVNPLFCDLIVESASDDEIKYRNSLNRFCKVNSSLRYWPSSLLEQVKWAAAFWLKHAPKASTCSLELLKAFKTWSWRLLQMLTVISRAGCEDCICTKRPEMKGMVYWKFRKSLKTKTWLLIFFCLNFIK